NLLLTLKCIFFSIFLGMLGNVFSDVTLMFLATVVVFVGPLAYSHNKALVDPVASQLNTRASQALNAMRAGPRTKAE
ncbi:MAG: reticulon family protein, partial [Flavobacteriaceae bacterium]|nr:reticulon family protein [Flavobacteriaceae bacterium]